MDETGVLSGRTRRVLDSTVLDDAVVTQDTVTMITSQVGKCRRLIPQAREVVLSHDYYQGSKPSCDWADPDSRSELINRLVTDGLAVLEAVRDIDLDDRQSEAVGLLGGGGRPGRGTRPRPGGQMEDRPPGRFGSDDLGRLTRRLGTVAKRLRSVGTVTKPISWPSPKRGSSLLVRPPRPPALTVPPAWAC